MKTNKKVKTKSFRKTKRKNSKINKKSKNIKNKILKGGEQCEITNIDTINLSENNKKCDELTLHLTSIEGADISTITELLKTNLKIKYIILENIKIKQNNLIQFFGILMRNTNLKSVILNINILNSNTNNNPTIKIKSDNRILNLQHEFKPDVLKILKLLLEYNKTLRIDFGPNIKLPPDIETELSRRNSGDDNTTIEPINIMTGEDFADIKRTKTSRLREEEARLPEITNVNTFNVYKGNITDTMPKSRTFETEL